jgi:hypothetical protein
MAVRIASPQVHRQKDDRGDHDEAYSRDQWVLQIQPIGEVSDDGPRRRRPDEYPHDGSPGFVDQLNGVRDIPR